MSGQSRGNQVGLVLKFGGLRKKRTWGKPVQKEKIPSDEVRHLTRH